MADEAQRGTLYVVPTPIGNLEDITLRALRILREIDFVACEDTRHTVQLLTHFDIRKPLVSFYSYNQHHRIPLVSDSGMPGISDPGFFLIREALDRNIPVVTLPGPSAAITALVGSGLPTDGFVFLGFLKKKAGKMKKELAEAALPGKTIVFYESPHRIHKTLSVCGEVFPPETPLVLARELTKTFEEYIRGTLKNVSEQMEKREARGEYVVLVSPPEKGRASVDDGLEVSDRTIVSEREGIS